MSEYQTEPIPKTEQEFINYRLDQDDRQINNVSDDVHSLAKTMDNEFATKQQINDGFALVNTKLNFQNKLIYGIISLIGMIMTGILVGRLINKL
jgi:hypothetical protein